MTSISSPATPSPLHPALSPAYLGSIKLPNRFAVAPMTRVSATSDGVPTRQMADYYAGFARGGFGLVITEGTYTDQLYSQGYANQPGAVTDAHMQGWRHVVDAVRSAGGHIIMQLMHAGALSQGNPHVSGTAGPSAVQPRGAMLPEYGGDGPWPVPAEMDRDDIDAVLDGFVGAAERALATGFDGVEIHAANGYLLDQFLTDYTNLRADRYGGDLDRRVRLLAEVAAGIRAATSPGFVVGMRLSQTKVNDVEYRWPGGARDAERIVAAVTRAHLDYLHIASEGRDWLETARLDNGDTVTALARRTGRLPVIANGGMHDPDQAGRVLDGEHADVVAVARGALRHPDLPQRIARGQEPERFDPAMLSPMATLDNAERWWAGRAPA
ncbi:NADH:flavin oxidoreductase [Actinobacteria bacterium YIM 96077]|uniref:NADH:flavin oxidoreductase n=1 Tax=Phytoactinopolyspora halophila TaxID=1981511 RepID=A0A329QVK5_9ACTN|nr:NADH:flavin oxidoreductase [Phytoactinopolyspora halophila]AYY12756.1 NADH:flavin oxidoreductase [Actinobacteria bacterium YIM 96077]RAW16450.1 NADH:flavin oxidoreductase [Phytoactinopolyspora halophila]